MDDKIATFKQKASGALPELMSLNLSLLNQTDRELMDLDQQIRSLEERKTYLEGELATIKPHTPILSVTGERILDSEERLRSLRAEYAGASANLAPDHPDIVKMKQEIKALEKETGQAPEIEPEYLALTRDRDTSGQKYQDIRSRLLEAKVSEGLEVQRKGEKFS